jgi:N-acetylglucosamine kinase-like BadF-type ATPase
VSQIYLGADVGSTKTQVLVADQDGIALGFGESGPGNHETVGYPGLQHALSQATGRALASAGLEKGSIRGAGFGVSGYDWPSERPATLQAIQCLGLAAPVEAVNDTILGILAGSADGCGIAVVSGTGCNCRGWDPVHQKEGRVVGRSTAAGEGAGSTELMAEVVKALCHEWTGRGPHTGLAPVLVRYAGAKSLDDLLEGIFEGHYDLSGAAAPLVFQAAAEGNTVARDLLRWAGCELAEMIKAVVRQMQFEERAFEVVLVGNMFNGGELLQEPMRQAVHTLAPAARFLRLSAPPVAGAVFLGMEAAGARLAPPVRENLLTTSRNFLEASPV